MEKTRFSCVGDECEVETVDDERGRLSKIVTGGDVHTAREEKKRAAG